jgi:hypothetical protein
MPTTVQLVTRGNNFVTCTAADAPVRGCPTPPAFFAANSGNKITGAFNVGINIAGSSNVVRGNYIDPPVIGISLANTAKGNDVRGNLVFADGGGSRGIEVLGPFPVTDSIDVPPDTIRENRIGDGTNPNTPNADGIFCSDRAARINNNLILGTNTDPGDGIELAASCTNDTSGSFNKLVEVKGNELRRSSSWRGGYDGHPRAFSRHIHSAGDHRR